MIDGSFLYATYGDLLMTPSQIAALRGSSHYRSRMDQWLIHRSRNVSVMGYLMGVGKELPEGASFDDFLLAVEAYYDSCPDGVFVLRREGESFGEYVMERAKEWHAFLKERGHYYVTPSLAFTEIIVRLFLQTYEGIVGERAVRRAVEADLPALASFDGRGLDLFVEEADKQMDLRYNVDLLVFSHDADGSKSIQFGIQVKPSSYFHLSRFTEGDKHKAFAKDKAFLRDYHAPTYYVDKGAVADGQALEYMDAYSIIAPYKDSDYWRSMVRQGDAFTLSSTGSQRPYKGLPTAQLNKEAA